MRSTLDYIVINCRGSFYSWVSQLQFPQFFFSDKRKISFPPAVHVDIALINSAIEKFATEILTILNLTLISHIEVCILPLHKIWISMRMVISVCRIPLVRLFLKLLHCKISWSYHVLLHACRVLQLLLLSVSYIFITVVFFRSLPHFCLPLPRTESRTTVSYCFRVRFSYVSSPSHCKTSYSVVCCLWTNFRLEIL